MRAGKSAKLQLMLGLAMLQDNQIKYEVEDFNPAWVPPIDRPKLDVKQEAIRTKRIKTKMAKAQVKRERKFKNRLRVNQGRRG